MEEGRIEQIESPEPAKKPGRSWFLLAWVAASVGGWFIGMLAWLAIGIVEWFSKETGSRVFYEQTLLTNESLYVCLSGFLACAMQGLFLRGRVLRAGRWVLASSVAWILAVPVLAAPLNSDTPHLLLLCVLAVFVGAMVGATQWLVVQGQASGAWRWILASAVGWGLFQVFALNYLLKDFHGVGFFEWASSELADPITCFLSPAGAAVAGVITGAALARCLRNPPSRPTNRRWMVLLVNAELVGVLWLLLLAAALAGLFNR